MSQAPYPARAALALAVVFATAALVGCEYTDPGSGTHTLNVVARLSFTASEDDEMDVRISVTRDGAVVNDASVVVTDGETGQKFVIDEQTTGQDRYRGTIEGYRRRIDLSVTSGADHLRGRLEGPGRHLIKTPANDSVLRRSDADTMRIRWAAEDGLVADEVEIRFEESEFRTTLEHDTGEVVVATAELVPGIEELRVTRTNNVTLAGGTSGSKLEIGYTAANRFDVE